MSLSQKIAAALDARPDNGALPCDVTAHAGRPPLTVHLTASGPVRPGFDGLEFAAHAPEDWSPDAVKRWGDRIASRVTYLIEPLVVLEHDKIGGDVELRSHAPTSRGDR